MRFEGWYLKHQKDGRTLALIPGCASEKAFIQVVTDEQAHIAEYPTWHYKKAGGRVTVGASIFAPEGVTLDIHMSGIELTGALAYRGLTPLSSDIMGPFRFFPMECRHSVVSMRHTVVGGLMLNGEAWDFDGGRGYIEGDSGRSFPTSYAWTQCSAFDADCSIMASIARIPFLGLRFWGCICVVLLGGREYRLATYHGARVRRMQKDVLELEQGKYKLLIRVEQAAPGHGLPAPDRGVMRRVIREAPACRAHYLFTEGTDTQFYGVSDHASFEFVE